MNNTVSVIIPVYKVEKYLDRCVESIVSQTYKNLEIILVDDGSPDGCPKMCDKWAQKDSRIKVIHKENGGLSSARNAGLDAMSGGYVYFADSDDYIEKDAIEALYNLTVKYGADMAFGRFWRVFEEKTDFNQPPFTGSVSVYGSEDEFWEAYYTLNNEHGMFEIAAGMIVSWNKLVKASVFEGLRFEEGKIHEDEFIVHRLVNKCKTTVFIDKKLYNYFQNPGGITACENGRSLVCLAEAFEERIDYFSAADKEYTKKAFNSLFSYCMPRSFKTDKKSKKKIRFYYRQAYKSAKHFIKKDSLKNRILHRAMYTGEGAYRFALKAERALSKIKRKIK